MFVLASPIVDWTAMWKICLVALGAGAGVVVAFGLMLLGLKFAQGPPTHGTHRAGAVSTPSAGRRLGAFTLSLACALICVGVVAIGVYAMVNKP